MPSLGSTRRSARCRLFQAGALVLLLLAVGCRRKHFPQYPSDFREYAWVTNGGGNSVTVFDLVNMQTAATIPVGEDPTELAVSPTRNEVYVVNSGSASVSVIDAVTNRVAATIPVHREPSSVSVDSLGQRAYVANAGSNNVSVLDLGQRREIEAIGVGESPAVVRVSPDGGTLVVTNRDGGSVSVIDAKRLRVRTVLSGCPQASDTVILPDSSKAFVACTGGHQVMSVGLARPISQNPEDRKDRLLALLDVGPSPVHLALKPDGGEIFVSNFGGDTISEIATGANEVGGAYVVGANPMGGVVSADNSTLWVSNFGATTRWRPTQSTTARSSTRESAWAMGQDRWRSPTMDSCCWRWISFPAMFRFCEPSAIRRTASRRRDRCSRYCPQESTPTQSRLKASW